ncbi:MAG TPA: hypothetical protein VK633_10365 [Verrucomicrobiae bacterium]|nr:hypothetical protein [Verrucomicrobiae bacterium]
MRNKLFRRFSICAGALVWLLSGPRQLRAFPPAPDHTFYGMVRDEMGNPLDFKDAEVLLETPAKVQCKASIFNIIEPGVNYELAVPMDSGLTDVAYKPTALMPAVSFKIWVRIKQIRYLPIQMKGDFSQLGQPGKRTRLDLTLGEDSDGDGLPDAWERALIAALGGGKTLADINPNDDADGDGLNNLNEYTAGTYAFDDKDGYSLKIVRTSQNNPVLEFMAIRGRTYQVFGSADFNNWARIPFRIEGTTTAPLDNYYADDVRLVQIEALPGAASRLLFFKLMIE